MEGGNELLFGVNFRDLLLFIIIPGCLMMAREIIQLRLRVAVIEAERVKEKEAALERRKGYDVRNKKIDEKLEEIDAHVKALPQSIVALLKEARNL